MQRSFGILMLEKQDFIFGTHMLSYCKINKVYIVEWGQETDTGAWIVETQNCGSDNLVYISIICQSCPIEYVHLKLLTDSLARAHNDPGVLSRSH